MFVVIIVKHFPIVDAELGCSQSIVSDAPPITRKKKEVTNCVSNKRVVQMYAVLT